MVPFFDYMQLSFRQQSPRFRRHPATAAESRRGDPAAALASHGQEAAAVHRHTRAFSRATRGGKVIISFGQRSNLLDSDGEVSLCTLLRQKAPPFWNRPPALHPAHRVSVGIPLSVSLSTHLSTTAHHPWPASSPDHLTCAPLPKQTCPCCPLDHPSPASRSTTPP